jgi:hypothetical protein
MRKTNGLLLLGLKVSLNSFGKALILCGNVHQQHQQGKMITKSYVSDRQVNSDYIKMQHLI